MLILYRPAGLPGTREIYLTNIGTENITIVNIYVDTIQITLQHNMKKPMVLAPGISERFSVTVTTSIVGDMSMHTYFKFSTNQIYIYKTHITSLENSYGFNPVLRNDLSIDETITFNLSMTNPFDEKILNINCARSFNNRFIMDFSSSAHANELCQPDAQPVSIQPHQTAYLGTLSYTPIQSGPHFGQLFITGKKVIYVVAYMLLAYEHPTMLIPRTLDFGTISLGENPRLLRIGIQPKKPVRIEGIYYKKDTNFWLNLPGLDTFPKDFPASSEIIHLGFAAFYAKVPGNYEGKIYFAANTSTMLEFEYRATVIENPIFKPGISTNLNSLIPTIRINVSNPIEKAISFAESSEKNVNLTILSNRDTSLQEISPQVHVFKNPFDPINLSLEFTAELRKLLPLNSYVALAGMDTYYMTPISIYDLNTNCSYNQMDRETNIKFIETRACKDIKEINVHLYGNIVNYLEFNITNFGKYSLQFSDLVLINATGICIEKIIFVNAKNEKIESTIPYDPKTSIFKKQSLISSIDAGLILTIKIILNYAKCSPLLSEPEENTKLANLLAFKLDKQHYEIKINAEFHSGDLTLSPASLTFTSDLPGPSQYTEIYASSSFKFPISILSAKSNERHVTLSNVAKILQPGTRVRLARVSFDPFKFADDEKSEMNILELGKKTISIGELRVWRKKLRIWESLSNSLSQFIETSIDLEADVAQQLKIPVKAELAYPKITLLDKIEFELTQKGSSAKTEFTIYNPSSEPLSLQLVLSDVTYSTIQPMGASFKEKCMAQILQLNNITRKGQRYHMTKKGAEICCGTIEARSKRSNSGVPEDEPEFETSPEPACDEFLVFQHNYALMPLIPYDTNNLPIRFSSYQTFTIPLDYTTPLVLPPGSHMKVRKIMFAPMRTGMHEATLFIKNNLTMLQAVKLVGRGGNGIIEFTECVNLQRTAREDIYGVAYDIEPIKPLIFSITALDVLEIIQEKDVPSKSIPVIGALYDLARVYSFSARLINSRAYIIRNRGNLPLIVNSMSVDHKGCAAYGIIIYNCVPFVLNPNEVATIVIQYQVSGALASITKPIVFSTPAGDQVFPMKFVMSNEILAISQRYPHYNSTFEVYIRLAISITLIACTVVINFVSLMEAFLIRKRHEKQIMNRIVKNKQRKSRSLISRTDILKQITDIQANREKLFPEKKPKVIIPEVPKIIPEKIPTPIIEAPKTEKIELVNQVQQSTENPKNEPTQNEPNQNKEERKPISEHELEPEKTIISELEPEKVPNAENTTEEISPKKIEEKPEHSEIQESNKNNETQQIQNEPEVSEKIGPNPKIQPIIPKNESPPKKVYYKQPDQKYDYKSRKYVSKNELGNPSIRKSNKKTIYVPKHSQVYVKKNQTVAQININETHIVQNIIEKSHEDTAKEQPKTNPVIQEEIKEIPKKPEIHQTIDKKEEKPIIEHLYNTPVDAVLAKRILADFSEESDPDPEVLPTYNPFSSFPVRLPENIFGDNSGIKELRKPSEEEANDSENSYVDIFKEGKVWGGYSCFSEVHPLIKPTNTTPVRDNENSVSQRFPESRSETKKDNYKRWLKDMQ